MPKNEAMEQVIKSAQARLIVDGTGKADGNTVLLAGLGWLRDEMEAIEQTELMVQHQFKFDGKRLLAGALVAGGVIAGFIQHFVTI